MNRQLLIALLLGVKGRTEMRAGRRRAVVAGCLCGDLGGGLALWTSFIFQSILNNAFRLAVGVRVHQIKKIASNYPINIIIFAAL